MRPAPNKLLNELFAVVSTMRLILCKRAGFPLPSFCLIVCKSEAAVSNGLLFVIPNPPQPVVAAVTGAVKNSIDL